MNMEYEDDCEMIKICEQYDNTYKKCYAGAIITATRLNFFLHKLLSRNCKYPCQFH